MLLTFNPGEHYVLTLGRKKVPVIIERETPNILYVAINGRSTQMPYADAESYFLKDLFVPAKAA